MNRLKRQEMKVFFIMLLFIMAVHGCGSAGPAKQAAESKTKPEKAVKKNRAESAGDTSEFKYIELTEVEDYYGDKSMYQVYAPRENSNENGYIFYSGHGLTFGASAMKYDSDEYLLDSLDAAVEFETEDWTADNSEFMDVEVGEVLENGEDRYQLLTAKKEDLYGTPYEVKHIYYLDIQENGSGVLWDLLLYEASADSDTEPLIDELAECYKVDLDIVKASGAWAAANEQRLAEEKAADSLPQTILWFNATYAPLTYSNGCDWEKVGGMEPSESNMEFNRQILSRDWDIDDAASAMETIEDLKKNGHRAKCRECMEKLDELGILDEKNEEAFLEALTNSGIEENLFRYVMAYQIHQSGLDADYIAAWDLCRVNQLYADFYICGYMSYEDAMNASLENSLMLQEMYTSWEDLATSYLAGYQFWRSDPLLTDDSPTMKRYQCYLDLLDMEDGPYSLDWNMKLEKSW